MIGWWGLAGSLASVAVGAELADRRRRRRADLDAMGIIDWSGVQLLAVAAALVAVSVALHA